MTKVFEFPKGMQLVEVYDRDGENGTTFMLVPNDLDFKDVAAKLPFDSHVGSVEKSIIVCESVEDIVEYFK